MLHKIKAYILKKRAGYYAIKRDEYYCIAKNYYEAHMFNEAAEALDKVSDYDDKWGKVAFKLMRADA